VSFDALDCLVLPYVSKWALRWAGQIRDESRPPLAFISLVTVEGDLPKDLAI
ncbi:unnamed protein product, partial [Acidithrix sp. C25]